MPLRRFAIPPIHASPSPVASWATAAVLIVVIGWFDFFSGTELRVFPLYYAPISLLAWNVGRRGALLAAGLSAFAWLGVNAFGGLQYSSAGIWVANTLVLAGSFAFVGLLISTLKGALLRERALSRTDPLTGLLNRRAFVEEGSRLLALCRRENHPVTMAYLDLDGFKAVNDRQGHEAGDTVLRSVAEALRQSTRPSDLCARLGGDEFAVLLPETGASKAVVALERLRQLVASRVVPGTDPVTASIGAVGFNLAPAAVEEMIAAADEQMYLAKTEGKDRVHVSVVS